MSGLTKLNILYVGSLQQEGNSYRRFKTLLKMGHDVEGIDVDTFIFGTIWMRFHFHLYWGPGIQALNRLVLRKMKERKPDVLWVDNKPYIKAATLRIIRKHFPDLKIINLLTDDPFGKYHYAWRFIYKTFKYYDVHFVQREINIPELKRYGARRVEMCFRSFDMEFHRKLSDAERVSGEGRIPVGFIGSYESEREEYILFLIQKGIPVKITGDGWSEGRHWDVLKEYYDGPSVYGEEYIRVINNYDIALHFLRKANRDQQDSRTFEIAACGTFMLAERSHLHLEFFQEGVEADFFTSREEMLEKVRFYLDNPDKREAIAEKGRTRCHHSGYDHVSRLTRVIDLFSNPEMNSSRLKKAVICIYYDPDFYPPTINAINNLSDEYEEVVVVTRNHSLLDFPYPGNVRLVKSGRYMTVQQSEQTSVLYKIFSFFAFSRHVWRHIREKQTQLAVFYDAIPLLSYYMMRGFVSREKVLWYHNHDMPNTHMVRRFSIGWFSFVFEHRAMRLMRYFSLPSDDRLAFYPDWNRPKDYFLIPNYPSARVYRYAASVPEPESEVRLIYQGTIGEEHALESVIKLLKEPCKGFSLRLILKGAVRPHYKQLINELAWVEGVADKLEWHGLGPYCELPALTRTCHIGLAIYMGTDNVRKTLGTASNKIYEYAASGLPVILFDNAQFRKYLQHYPWARFTDGTPESIKSCLYEILDDLGALSKQARASFEQGLTFEKGFEKIVSTLKPDPFQ